MDVFYTVLAVVFYLLSGCLSFTLNKDDAMSQIYLVGGMVSLVVGTYFILTLLNANGF
jgi:hypothetical protein